MRYPRSAKPALIVGSVAIDRVATPFAQSDNILGGAASYASIASSYFAPTRLIGAVGHDFPRPFWQKLAKHGIDLTGLQVDAKEKTFFWSGKYHENFAGRDTLEVQLNVFEKFSPALPARASSISRTGPSAITPATPRSFAPNVRIPPQLPALMPVRCSTTMT